MRWYAAANASISACVTFHGSEIRIASPASVPRPIACSTWLVVTLPELHAAPALTAIALQVQRDHLRPGRRAGQRQAGGVGQPSRRIAADHRAARHRRLLRRIPQRRHRRQVVVLARLRSRGEAGDQRHRRRAAAPPPLLPAAADQRFGERRIRRQQQRTHARGPAQLVRRNRQAVRPQAIEPHRHPPRRLHRIDMQ